MKGVTEARLQQRELAACDGVHQPVQLPRSKAQVVVGIPEPLVVAAVLLPPANSMWCLTRNHWKRSTTRVLEEWWQISAGGMNERHKGAIQE